MHAQAHAAGAQVNIAAAAYNSRIAVRFSDDGFDVFATRHGLQLNTVDCEIAVYLSVQPDC